MAREEDIIRELRSRIIEEIESSDDCESATDKIMQMVFSSLVVKEFFYVAYHQVMVDLISDKTGTGQ